MNILVVGGAGHVGSILRPALEAEHICRHFDRRPVPGAQDRTVIGDVNDEGAVVQALRDVQAVVYLAMGVGGPSPGSCNDLDAAFNVNVCGAYRFLRLALAGGIRRFIYASSGSVYSKAGKGSRFIDEATLANAWDPYGLSKRVGEFLCQAAAQEYPDAMIIALRLFMPRSEAQWAADRNTTPSRGWHWCQAPGDLRRAFLAALICNKPGSHIVQTTGDIQNRLLPNTHATELLGWKPTGD